jgi:anti-sigma-K factor RskA
MNYLHPERLDLLAREYALGTMNGGARRRFERVLRQSPAATMAVGVWQDRLARLAGSVPAMQPRDAVWQGLEQRLFAGAADAPSAAAAKPSPWRWLAEVFSGRTLGSALAGMLLCVLVLRLQPGLIGMEPERDALPASYVGLLTDAAGKPTVLASSRRHGRQLTVKLLQPVVVPAGAVAQLWALPKDGSAPFPVGVVPGQGSAQVALADSSEKLFFNVARLAVSIEAAPAKAGDKPSGDFVLSGHCVKLW